jgi:ribosomal-protein-serine acetyltransferase
MSGSSMVELSRHNAEVGGSIPPLTIFIYLTSGALFIMLSIPVSSTIVLKPLQLQDAGQLFEIVNSHREYLRRWLPWVDGTKSEADSLGFIKFTQKQNEEGEALVLGVWLNNTELLGTVSLVSINKVDSSAELGYWIKASHQGNGYITQSCKSLMQHAFKELQLNSVFIRSVTSNKSSMKLLKRLTVDFEASQCEEWVDGKKSEKVAMTKGIINKQQWLARCKKDGAVGRYAHLKNIGLSMAMLVAGGFGLYLSEYMSGTFMHSASKTMSATSLLAGGAGLFFTMMNNNNAAPNSSPAVLFK